MGSGSCQDYPLGMIFVELIRRCSCVLKLATKIAGSGAVWEEFMYRPKSPTASDQCRASWYEIQSNLQLLLPVLDLEVCGRGHTGNQG